MTFNVFPSASQNEKLGITERRFLGAEADITGGIKKTEQEKEKTVDSTFSEQIQR